MSSNNNKKTIYIDVDEEITGIIDLVRSADENILALVLPKRATVLQSIVNMKLLKRGADQSDKKVVLITSESTLLPLAGAAGIHVASNLQSRPYIPSQKLPTAADHSDPLPKDGVEEGGIDPATPVGELAKDKNTTDPIEIDNRQQASSESPKSAKKPKKDKSKKIPNFKKFRLLLALGIAGIILLIGGLSYAFFVAPNATATLRTESSEQDVEAKFSADTTADSVDLEDKVLPAKNGELKKNVAEKVPATGETDKGTKASGRISLRNCTDNGVNIPAGTGVSNGNFTFITQESVALNDGNFDSSENCKTSGDHTGAVNVIAQKNGDQYNLSSRSYTVAGFSGVVAQGDQMSGGTTKVVKVISAQDVENAKKRITDNQNASAEELKKNLEKDGYVGIVDTFSAGSPNFTPNPAVGAEANEVTVTADVTYTMIGVKEDDLKELVKEAVKEDIDITKQSILSYGFDDASYEVGTKRQDSTSITLRTKIVAGPEIDEDQIKNEIKGKKPNEAEAILETRPGITEATVKTSPFWVTKVPGGLGKIKINVEQANGEPITP